MRTFGRTGGKELARLVIAERAGGALPLLRVEATSQPKRHAFPLQFGLVPLATFSGGAIIHCLPEPANQEDRPKTDNVIVCGTFHPKAHKHCQRNAKQISIPSTTIFGAPKDPSPDSLPIHYGPHGKEL